MEFGLLSIIYSFLSLILGEAAQGLTRTVEFSLLFILYSLFFILLGACAAYSSTAYAMVVISAISGAEVSRREYWHTIGVLDSSRTA